MDDLHFHDLIKEDEKDFKVFPAFRPDKALNIDASSFAPWFETLVSVHGKEITSFKQFINVLEDRVDFFHEKDCRVSDHALEAFVYETATPEVL